MKKTIITIIFLCSIMFQSLTFAQTLNWAKGIGGPGDESGVEIAVDDFGNIYTTGSFSNTVDFDPNSGISNLISLGGGDIFIQKLDASGNFLWAKSFGGSVNDRVVSISVDSEGNAYLIGYYEGVVDFDPSSSVFNLVSAGKSDIYLLKLDAGGDFEWVKSFGGPENDEGTDITLSEGDIYITGYFRETVDFDPNNGVTNLTSFGVSADVFILKLDTIGNIIWVKSIGGSENDLAHAISADSDGNIYTVGQFSSTVDFDPNAGVFILSSPLNIQGDVFTLKLDSAGNFKWAKSINVFSFSSLDVISDDSGNVYTVGSYYDTADFDPNVGVFNLVSMGSEDIFIQKLDKDGNFIWAKSMGGKEFDSGLSIAVDNLGCVYTTGFFQDTVDFDPNNGVTNKIAQGNFDYFLQKLDQNGNLIWVVDAGSSTNNVVIGNSISVDNLGHVYVCGSFLEIINFEPNTGVTNLISAGSSDVFVLKLTTYIAGIQDVIGIPEIKMYPNPNNGLLNIELPKDISHAQIVITNISGKTVYAQELTSPLNVLGLVNLQSGFYNISLISENELLLKGKLVLKK